MSIHERYLIPRINIYLNWRYFLLGIYIECTWMIWKALESQYNIKLFQPICNIFSEGKKTHHWTSSSVYNIVPKQLHAEMWVTMCFADFRTRLQWQALWTPHANTEQVCHWHPTVLLSKDNSHCQEHAGK